MGLALVIVEAEELSSCALTPLLVVGALGRLPLGHALHWLCDFLFQQLELTLLQGRKKLVKDKAAKPSGN